MDASLESPLTPLNVAPGIRNDNDDQSIGDEETTDWTKMLRDTNRPVIPKRGEKEFEPANATGSSLQLRNLELARFAMFEALKATRSISSKNVSYGIWYPAIARTHVTQARGIHFTTLGHFAPRAIDIGGRTQKRLELLPEEALFLIDRGALLCWKESDLFIPGTQGLEDIRGSPMTVQQAFADMIGKGGLTLEQYQVYAYLKRLGYVVIRVPPISPHHPTSSLLAFWERILQNLFSVVSNLVTGFGSVASFNCWRPRYLFSWRHRHKTYGSIFKSLRFIPSGHQVPSRDPNPLITSPYRITFHVYKPSTPFSKTSPPPPDFSVVVVNGRTTPMPTLAELTALYDDLPILPPPAPRKRGVPPLQKPVISSFNQTSEKTGSFWKIFTLRPWSRPKQNQVQVQKPNPFVALKSGHKAAIVAVVDAGIISFFRFGQGAFSHWPMI